MEMVEIACAAFYAFSTFFHEGHHQATQIKTDVTAIQDHIAKFRSRFLELKGGFDKQRGVLEGALHGASALTFRLTDHFPQPIKASAQVMRAGKKILIEKEVRPVYLPGLTYLTLVMRLACSGLPAEAELQHEEELAEKVVHDPGRTALLLPQLLGKERGWYPCSILCGCLLNGFLVGAGPDSSARGQRFDLLCAAVPQGRDPLCVRGGVTQQAHLHAAGRLGT
jgi:hypothetical protein